MTITELIDNMAEFLKPVVADYNAQKDSVQSDIKIIAGYPPKLDGNEERPSAVYVMVNDAIDDTAPNDFSKATVTLSFDITDNDKVDGWRNLYNLMEHTRQELLKHRIVAKRNKLLLPIKFKTPFEQPWPHWQGAIIADYTIGQPEEEGFIYDDFISRQVGPG